MLGGAFVLALAWMFAGLKGLFVAALALAALRVAGRLLTPRRLRRPRASRGARRAGIGDHARLSRRR